MIAIPARFLLLAAVLVPIQIGAATTASADTFVVKGDFKTKDGEPNISGVDCLAAKSDGTRLCLAVDDELKAVQFATLQGLELTVGNVEKVVDAGRKTVGKPPGEFLGLPDLHCSKKFDSGEMDGEAVAHIGQTFYVIGSHGCSKKGKYRPQTFALSRIEVDPDGKIVDFTVSYRLSEVLSAAEAVKAVFGIDLPPASEGASIEALAASDGKLFIGFRSPAVEQALILEVPISGLFEEGATLSKATPHPVKLGARIGFRDLEVLGDGSFIALTGPDAEAEPNSPYALQRLDATFAPIGDALTVNAEPDGSPEAIEVLGTTTDEKDRVALFSDGLKNGGPVLIDMNR